MPLGGSLWVALWPSLLSATLLLTIGLQFRLYSPCVAQKVFAWLTALLPRWRALSRSAAEKNLFFFNFGMKHGLMLFIYQPVQSKSLFVISVSKIWCATETLPSSSTLPSLTYSWLPRFRKYFHLVAPCLGRSQGEPTSEQQSPTFQVQARF